MKVLVADDDTIARVTLQTLLAKHGYDVVLAHDGHQAFEFLQALNPPAMAILDWEMPGIDGIELCRRIRTAGRGAYTYVIMLTAKGEKRHFREAMEAGADDYLSKPFDGEELRLRLRAGERIVALQEQLRIEARVDALTATLNRGAILGVLRRGLAKAIRDQEPLAVILIDLDNFKLVNDTFGHPVGDAVLQHVAEALGTSLREYDALGRYGGEEFIVISPACDIDQATTLGERIRRAVEATTFQCTAGPIPITVSVGVAAGYGLQEKADDLILLADNALYSAKRNGRNRVEAAGTKPAVFKTPARRKRPKRSTPRRR